jgi:hypothetical protein
MSLSDPILTGPGAGRTVDYGHGSSAELKIAGEQSGGDWAVVEWRVRAGDEPPMHTHTRENETLLSPRRRDHRVRGWREDRGGSSAGPRAARAVPVPELYLAERVAGV